ncbi:MAG TPA: beta-ketoacyl-[acyl-carrier-protein] synthase family protein [Candidatus Accumulibacter phosphatis]|nr:beta-ketoacyl-[acyl-carrier-protein] synthase family protein [Accumulibacter sp.]HCN66786.1 beta-ketoacyl-[acyl-carrier-protein] synthase family protein [Accumulibacter sp.]HCV13360.1 beta-ketoacyl-[acyl-carrier-protein] synthase family protein [Accumulibacter sp.]HRL78422.1 beta-ketoacyl-[acyl-carrier-protein] synthase family protein [Candidatus Accumulibacter phosphatis]HRQ97329.1 beta-ketoacyl-[acyl-carrier-protein] synthase family protein [Candidatus Accumulibacter phosphatis]
MMRVAVTGMGVVSPLGNAAAAVFANAQAGRSAIRRLDVPFATRLVAPLVASANFDAAEHFEPPKRRMLDRVSQFALVAASQALGGARDALSQLDRSRAGVFVGTGMGGSQTSDDGYKTLYGDDSDRIKPFTVLMGMHNAPAAWIGIEHDLRGPNLTYSTACSSSAVAIGEAWRRVAGGDLEVAIAGGAEAPLSFGSLKAWEALHTLAAIDAIDPSASCKPFSKNRSGMVLGEGAAMLVLEPWERAVARGASIHGEILGYGLSTDASHITRPSVEGQAAAMHAALRAAAIAPSAVDAINAHGTGTQANDAIETAAIKTVFGKRAGHVPISATKALHGHLLGAAGALECVLSLLAMESAVVLPTMHLQAPDPECDLDYVPNAAREAPAVRTMLSNSFAFGGTNAVLVLGAAP